MSAVLQPARGEERPRSEALSAFERTRAALARATAARDAPAAPPSDLARELRSSALLLLAALAVPMLLLAATAR